MNLVEHYIENVFSETDVTKEFEKSNGYAPHERIYLIDMDVNCYGVKERVQRCFFESELISAKKNVYYMA